MISYSHVRKKHFSIPTFCILQLSEYIGLINTINHKTHHNHDDEHLDKVTNFFDVWFPCGWFFDKLFTKIGHNIIIMYIFTYCMIWCGYLLQLDVGVYLYGIFSY
jgi:hypothetical protein